MTIDVVIPNFNGLALIKKNLPSILSEIKKFKGKVILVDDFSESDEFVALVEFVKFQQDSGAEIILLRNDKNYGFSTSVNRGISESKADFVVLLNTDVTPEGGCLDYALADLLQDENLFGVGMMDKSIEGGRTVLRGRGLATWRRGFVQHRRAEVDSADTFWVSGGSSVIRRAIFMQLGGMDSLYDPFYWEDIDLSYRARKSGYKIMFEKGSIVKHDHSAGAIKKNYSNDKIKTIAYRNQFVFVWKNITDIGLLLSHIVWLPYHILNAIVSMDSPFLLGFLGALIRFPAIINARRKQGKLYKSTDSDLFKS